MIDTDRGGFTSRGKCGSVRAWATWFMTCWNKQRKKRGKRKEALVLCLPFAAPFFALFIPTTRTSGADCICRTHSAAAAVVLRRRALGSNDVLLFKVKDEQPYLKMMGNGFL